MCSDCLSKCYWPFGLNRLILKECLRQFSSVWNSIRCLSRSILMIHRLWDSFLFSFSDYLFVCVWASFGLVENWHWSMWHWVGVENSVSSAEHSVAADRSCSKIYYHQTNLLFAKTNNFSNPEIKSKQLLNMLICIDTWELHKLTMKHLPVCLFRSNRAIVSVCAILPRHIWIYEWNLLTRLANRETTNWTTLELALDKYA